MMKKGDLVWYKEWNVPVLLLHYFPAYGEMNQSYWEVIIEGESDLVFESELEEKKRIEVNNG